MTVDEVRGITDKEKKLLTESEITSIEESIKLNASLGENILKQPINRNFNLKKNKKKHFKENGFGVKIKEEPVGATLFCVYETRITITW